MGVEDRMKPLLLATLTLLGAPAARDEGPQAKDSLEGTLFFFFSGGDAFSPAAARSLAGSAVAPKAGVRVRPVLLVEDWKAWTKATPESPLFRTLRELGGGRNGPGVNIPVYDLEGLALARAWKLSRLPAFVLVAHGRAHVVYGTRIDLAEVSGCDQ
jgi:hypothetical protein